MKPSKLLAFLARAILARLSVLITGAPGIGKSDIVAQAALHAGADVIISHPAVADPTDAKGLPWIVDGHATFLPFGELERALHADRPTIWFLDDLGQASPAVQASFMQLLLARRVNGHLLSDHVTFVAASNRRTDRAGVSGILEPVKSRFGAIVELVADVDDWCRWALTHDIPPEMIGFIRFQPDRLCAFAATADLTNSPVPRTWAHAARILQLDLPPDILPHAVAGAIGMGAATEFMGFLRLYRELPSIDQLLRDPASVAMPTSPATLYALSSALAYRATVDTFEQIGQFVNRMLEAGHGEFGVLAVRDAITRTPTLTDTHTFVRLATGELGELIAGS